MNIAQQCISYVGPRQLTATNCQRTPPIGLSRAILKIFYYPQSHLAQTLTLRRYHYDEINDEIIDKTVGSRSVYFARHTVPSSYARST